MNTTILKDSNIPRNSVLAAGAIYSKSSNPRDGRTNCIFAGIPAKVIRENIDWDRRHTYDYDLQQKDGAR